jgi:hypothetical protein
VTPSMKYEKRTDACSCRSNVPVLSRIIPIRLALTLAAVLAATPYNANAQDGDVAAGHSFAREVCETCLVVQPQEAPRRILIGPAFRDIANTPGMTATALRVFLETWHPKMPNLILAPEEKADVIAYILSLRDRP